MLQWIGENVAWMYWTVPSALVFGGLFVAIAGMGVWDRLSPNVNRKGVLPIATSRGDRFFIGIISTIGIHLVWMALFGGVFLWGALALSVVLFYGVARWG